ncbi:MULTISPECIES: hypothetical protein [unclassified Methylobacterium]|jgi:hypothetical protein|uniref:hypothetical protein n=1 Tax=unclassified Methylobacterium TaxID=2615210 RepID=UPI001354C66A|nr:hypothetical protein [Methylobacterium sp. 2A]MWV22391.1 hypothetical protein [Methylobacterium sp. 2A]
MRRCFVCAADMLGSSVRALTYPDGRRRTFPRACGSCGVLLAHDADPAACREHLARHLAAPVFVSDPEAPYGLDIYTLRTAATGLDRGIDPLDAAGRAALRHPHDQNAARADLFPLAEAGRPPVSLGLLCRPAERDAALASLPERAGWTDDVVILLDGPARAPRAVPVAGFPDGAVRVAARPLDGDFAAQRNALQDLARHAWMLQLDADESLDPAAGRRLPALAALAEAGDAVSIGLARANRVDGVLSDVFPDVQYRLNRTRVRFAGRVHERPVLDGGWPRSFIALHGVIAHRLEAAHVRARSRRYEALDPGRGRLDEEAALLRPYAD